MKRICVYGKGGIGKSTAVSNLAAAMAQAGKRVAVVGCDPKADSTRGLMGRRIPTVLDQLKTGASGEIAFTDSRGVRCIEAGGPEPGTGCAGRGIIVAMEEIRSRGLLDDRECQRFTSFEARAERLYNHVEMLREYVLQIREMYQTQIDVSQNHAMNLLTVVTSLFLPLSILVGWYGMNFPGMPEFGWKYGYPTVILISILIIVLEILYFKKKKML